jgi:hypothetical protein
MEFKAAARPIACRTMVLVLHFFFSLSEPLVQSSLLFSVLSPRLVTVTLVFVCFLSAFSKMPDGHFQRPRASTLSEHHEHVPQEKRLPTMFKWDGGGKEVYISGTFTNWKPIPMVKRLATSKGSLFFFCPFPFFVRSLL